jgi:hypothetical protein
MPLMSHEVRWFFPGELARFPELEQWIKGTKPFPDEGDVPPPEPEGRLGDAPDVYLLVPGAEDMGIKWREGELQIKGRVSRRGLQRFGHRFYGAVEVWAKWSYKHDDVKQAFTAWFGDGPSKTWVTVPVRKTRTLRKTRLDARGRYVEVSRKSYPDRGLGAELTDLEIEGRRYCSLAFEAFPDDSGMSDAFTEAVDAWLRDLEAAAGVVLAEHQSMGYPQFLKGCTTLQTT